MYLAAHSSSVRYTNRLITTQLITLGIAALTLLLSLHYSSVEYGGSFNTTPLIGLGILVSALAILLALAAHGSSVGCGDSFNTTSLIGLCVSVFTLLLALAAHGSRVGYGDSFNTTPLIGLAITELTILLGLAAHCSRAGYGDSFNTTPLTGLGISVPFLLSLTAYSSSVWYLWRFSILSGSLDAKTSKFTPKSPVLRHLVDIFHTIDRFCDRFPLESLCFFALLYKNRNYLYRNSLHIAQLIVYVIASLALRLLTSLRSGIRHYTLGLFHYLRPATLLDNSESRQAAGVSRAPVREQQAWRLDYIIGTGAYGTVFLENVHLRGMKSPELWAVKRIPQTLPSFTSKRFQAEITNLEALSRVSISRTRTIS